MFSLTGFSWLRGSRIGGRTMWKIRRCRTARRRDREAWSRARQRRRGGATRPGDRGSSCSRGRRRQREAWIGARKGRAKIASSGLRRRVRWVWHVQWWGRIRSRRLLQSQEGLRQVHELRRVVGRRRDRGRPRGRVRGRRGRRGATTPRATCILEICVQGALGAAAARSRGTLGRGQ